MKTQWWLLNSVSANIFPWLLHTGPLSWLTTSTLGLDGRTADHQAVVEYPVLYVQHVGLVQHGGTRVVPGKVSLRTTPHHSLFPVWTAASASCVNVKRTFWGQMCNRRRYDPAAICLLSSSAPSLLTARLRERREGSHLRASPVCCCCRNQDILPAPHRNSRDFFFSLGGCAPSSSSWK